VKNGSDSDVTPPDELRALEQSFSGDGFPLEDAFNKAWEGIRP